MALEAVGKSMTTFAFDFAHSAQKQLSTQEVECLRILQDDDNIFIFRRVKELGHHERIGIAGIDPEWFHGGGFRKEFISII
jgi:hypothetical protein